MTQRYDVAVIGAGVLGCATAYCLAQRGARVVIVDRGMVGAGSSAVNSGAIAMATKKPGLMLDMAMASQRLYEELLPVLGADIEYEVYGNLIIAESETEHAYLEDMVAAQRAAGVGVELVSDARCRELNPLLEGRVLSGAHCATDAQVNPFRTTRAFAEAAQRLGAELVVNAPVTGIDVADGRVAAVRTPRGAFEADWVVNAAGVWASEIGRLAGHVHEMIPRRGQMIVLEASPGLPTIRVSGVNQLMVKHGGPPPPGTPTPISFGYTPKPRSGTVLIGSTNEFVGLDTRVTEEVLAGICACTGRLMPALAGLNVIRAWAGCRPYAAQGGLLLGHCGGPQGYLMATGHGGDGVALAPVSALYIAESIDRGGRDYTMADFIAERKAAQ